MSIGDNIQAVRKRIESACARAGRKSDDIKLVAVSKTVGYEKAYEAVTYGIGILGENRVQEIVEKYPHIPKDFVDWHMIGHLQTNKVKYIVDKVSMIHSVDSLKLVEEIDRRFRNYGRIIDILVEINIGREENKHGIKPEEALEFITLASSYNNLRILGLMTVAPAFADSEYVRPYFKEMKSIFEIIKDKDIQNVNMKYLSMGMTNDFEVAIEEGANIVRIGTGIFGPRDINVKEVK